MIILGIDPGTGSKKNAFAYGIVEKKDGFYHPIDFGPIRTKARDKPLEKLARITQQLNMLFKMYPNIKYVALEKPYIGKYPKAFESLCKISGAAMAIACIHGVEILGLFSPAEVKACVCKGNASKTDVARMVSALLEIPEQPPDVSDALAVSLCGHKELDMRAIREAAHASI